MLERLLQFYFFSRPSVNNLLPGQLWSNNIESEIRWPQCRQTKQAPRGRQRPTGQMKAAGFLTAGCELHPPRSKLTCRDLARKGFRNTYVEPKAMIGEGLPGLRVTSRHLLKLGHLERSWWLRVKNLPALQETQGRSPGGGNSSPFQYSALENPMDRGAWLHGVTKN